MSESKQLEQKRETGRWASIVAAIAALSLLTFQCYQADKRNQDLPQPYALIELGIFCSCLGVSIDSAAIGQLVQSVIESSGISISMGGKKNG